MGKSLIIKGADFSANAIEVYRSLSSVNRTLSIAQGSFGTISSSASPTRITAALDNDGSIVPVLVPKGMTIKVRGLKGVSDYKSPLRLDYVYFSDNRALSQFSGSAVGTGSNFDSSNYYPYNADGTLDEVEIENTYGQDYYFAFAIKGINDGDIPTTDYNLEYCVI